MRRAPYIAIVLLLASTVGCGSTSQAASRPSADEDARSLHLRETITETSNVHASAYVDGALWFATDGGLVRRDAEGRTRVFGARDGLMSGPITVLAVADPAHLWVGNAHGLAYGNADGFHFVADVSGVAAIAVESRDAAYAVCINRDVVRVTSTLTHETIVQVRGAPYSAAVFAGQLHVGTSHGLYAWDGSVMQVVRSRARLLRQPVFALAAEGDVLRVATAGQIFNVLRRGPPVSSAATVEAVRDARAVAIDSDGHTLFGTWGSGAYRLARDGTTSALPGTEGTRVQSISTYQEGGATHIVVGHTKGALLDGRAVITPRLPSANISALASRDGSLYVGTFADGLAVIDTHENIRIWNEESGLIDNRVNALLSTDDAVWLALDHGVCRLRASVRCWRDGEGPAQGHALALSSTGASLLVGSSGGLARFDGTAWHSIATGPDRVTSISVDEARDVWVGTAHGLYHLGAEEAGFPLREERNVASRSLVDDWVTLATPTSDQQMWVGTYSSGLMRTKPNAGFQNVATTAWINSGAHLALASNVDVFGGLDEGVILTHQGSVERIREGLPSLDVTSFVEHRGEIWIGTRAGLVRAVYE